MKRPRQQVTTLIAIALTFGSGAMDVASFTRLGGVFASVMTGNIVLCGLAAARGSVSLIAHTATAFAGYVAGVAGGTRIGWYHSARTARSDSARSDSARSDSARSADTESKRAGADSSGSDADSTGSSGGNRAGAWAPHVRAALLAELALLVAFTIGWEVAGSNPGGGAQFWLLADATAAMGMQASAVTQMGLTDVSTTYLTGTLTGLVGSLASPARRKREGIIRPGVLAGLLAGALLSGLLVKTAPAGVPALPVAALIVVVLLSTAPPRR
jgi:uncharacterized membrane protein YoaK (UPF0700 family)